MDISRPRDMDMLLSCSSLHLCPELENPHKIIIPMGAAACHVLDSGIQLDLHHGIPRETAWGTVFPMWHPAGGIHEPKKMLHIRNDWVRLGKYLKGKLKIPEDHLLPEYHEVGAEELLSEYIECNALHYSLPLALDTEITRFRDPYVLTYSRHPGTAYLIRADNTDALEIFQAMLDQQTGPILWHNYLGVDEKACRDMGLRMPWHLIVDTMVRAFHLGNLPQGLKALAYRLLGMTMTDFDDVVLPHSTPLALEYLRAAQSIDWPRPQEQALRDDKTGEWKMYKPQSMNTKIKRFFTDLSKNPAKSPFEMWDKKWTDSRAMIEAELGPWPGKDIQHVPWSEMVHYACRDADALIRVWPVLEHMTRNVRHKVQEHWGD